MSWSVQTAIRVSQIAVLLAIGLIAGCGGSPDDQPKLGYVTGNVTLDGQPLADANVFFSPDEGGRTSVGRTDVKGHYELNYTGAETGAKVGQHVARVTTSGEIQDPQTGQTVEAPEKVPDRYNAHSDLHREVKPGNNTIDFDLKSQ